MLVFWLAAQASAAGIEAADPRDAVGPRANSDKAWQFAPRRDVCETIGENGITPNKLCTAKFLLTDGAIPILGKWQMIIALISLAFTGLFYLFWKSVASYNGVFLENREEDDA